MVKPTHSVTECMIYNLICCVYGNIANNALCETVHRFYQTIIYFQNVLQFYGQEHYMQTSYSKF